MYVADRINHAIRRVDTISREVTTVAGSPNATAGFADGTGTVAPFDRPDDVALATDTEYLRVSDSQNRHVRLVFFADKPSDQSSGERRALDPRRVRHRREFHCT